jgi:hypothetical protein
VLIEEIGGDPLQITVNTMSVTKVYNSVSEFSTPSPLLREKHPAVHLRCQKGKHITDIEFASYGNPIEDCIESGRSCHGSCHTEVTEFVVKNVKFCQLKLARCTPKAECLTTKLLLVLYFQACLSRRKCAIPVLTANFGGDPCPGIKKSLSRGDLRMKRRSHLLML